MSTYHRNFPANYRLRKGLSRWVGRLPLATIIVGRDPTAMDNDSQLNAMHRAISERLATFLDENSLPSPRIHVVDLQDKFRSSKAYVLSLSQVSANSNEEQNETPSAEWGTALEGGSEKRGAGREVGNEMRNKMSKGRKPLVPCSTSLNWFLDVSRLADQSRNSDSSNARRANGAEWTHFGQVEVTTGNDGMIQGSTKKRKWNSGQNQCPQFSQSNHTSSSCGVSRLASRSIAKTWAAVAQAEPSIESSALDYARWKEEFTAQHTNKDYDRLEESFFHQEVFQGWVRIRRGITSVITNNKK